MVERYTYEETLYNTVVNIIRGDQLKYLTLQKQEGDSPLIACSTTCGLCHSIYHPSSKALLFRYVFLD